MTAVSGYGAGVRDTATAAGARRVRGEPVSIKEQKRISLTVRCIIIDDKQRYTIASCQMSLCKVLTT